MTFFYFVSYLTESLTLFLFNENIFEQKPAFEKKKYNAVLLYVSGFILSWGISFFEIPAINLCMFVLTTFAVTFIIYRIKIRHAFFITLSLTVLMFLTELAIISFSASFFDIGAEVHFDDPLVFVLQASLSKLLYFLSVFFVMKVFFRQKYRTATDKYLLMLAFLPAATVFMFLFLIEFKFSHTVSDMYSNALSIGTVLLLIANILVFYIYSLIQKTNNRITELSLEKQKEKSTREYYELLLSKQENYSILVHDLKRHLGVIESFARTADNNDIVSYIDSVRKDFGIDGNIRYSNNKLIDVMIKRYSDMCREKNILFTADTSYTPEFSENVYELTSLLDNMLEKAVESAQKCEKAFITFSISKENENYISVTVTNSCHTKPIFKGGIPQTSKQGKNHGIGTKSMKRAAEKLCGSIDWNYNEFSRCFITEATFKYNKFD